MAIIYLLTTDISANRPPNVLFISVDDLNDYVSSMRGSISIPTPNIDRILDGGTLFSNAHCQAPICGPSRAAIMTSLYPSSSGNYLQLKDQNIKSGSPTVQKATFLPDYFEAHGYRTLGVGKIFHQGDGAEVFDQYGGKFSWMGPKPEVRFNYDPAWYEHKVGNTQTDWGAYPDQDSLMTDYLSANWAVERLGESDPQPFFMAVGFVRPHVPLYTPQPWLDRFPLSEIATPPYRADDLEDVPATGRAVAEAPMMPTTEEVIASGQWKAVIQAYSASVAFVDAQIGRVLDALERSEYADNTVIVIWSDHGYHLGEKNRFAKQALWERSTRTLLAFQDRRRPNTQVCDAAVQLIDIYPTLLDLAGLPPYGKAEGRSLIPLLRDPDLAWPYPALTMYGPGNISIRDRRYRMIRYSDDSRELYDMKRDPNEWRNLAGRKNKRKTMRRLEAAIPEVWAPNSPHSYYNFNDYFRQITGTE